MTGENWRRAKRLSGAVTRVFGRVALWTLVAFAWCLRKTLTPAASFAGKVEAWALSKLEGK